MNSIKDFSFLAVCSMDLMFIRSALLLASRTTAEDYIQEIIIVLLNKDFSVVVKIGFS